MLTRELMRRLIRLTTSRELDQAPVETISTLCDAASAAMQEVWLSLPAEAKRETLVFDIAAPKSILVAVTPGSTRVGTFFRREELWCAVMLHGDPLCNRVAGDVNLWRKYDGSESVAPGTLWHDAVALPETSSVMNEAVWLEDATGMRLLQAWDASHTGIWTPPRAPLWIESLTVSPQIPTHYSVRSLGARANLRTEDADDEAPTFFLHLYPRPVAACRLHAQVTITAPRIYPRDVQTNRRLPVPDRMTLAMGDLAAEALLPTPIVNVTPEQSREIKEAAARARKLLRTLAETHVTTPSAQFGTPIGY